MPVFSSATVAKPPRKAKEEPRKAGTLNFEQRWKKRVPAPAMKSVTWTDSPSP